MVDHLDLNDPIRPQRTKRVKLDVDEVVRRYLAGESPVSIADNLGGSPKTIRRRLRERGVLRSVSEAVKLRAQTTEGLAQMRAAQKLANEAKRRNDLIAAADDIATAYIAGESARALGERYSCGSCQIADILRAKGIEVRDKSAAGVLRASKIPDDVKVDFYQRVATLNRGRIKPAVAVAQGASTKHRRMSQTIGAGEQEVAEHLAAAGFDVDRQVAVDRYNIDVTASGVAVEIHTAPHGPHLGRGRIHRRVDHLTDRGWRVLYVWCPRGISANDLEQIVTNVEALRLHPSTPGQYTVLRCEGNSRPRRGANRYQGSFVVSTRQVSNTAS